MEAQRDQASFPHPPPPLPCRRTGTAGPGWVHRSFATLRYKPKEIAHNALPQENQRLARSDSNPERGVGVAGPLIVPDHLYTSPFPPIFAPLNPYSYLDRSKLLLDQLLELTSTERLRFLPLPGIALVTLHHVSDGFDEPRHVSSPGEEQNLRTQQGDRSSSARRKETLFPSSNSKHIHFSFSLSKFLCQR